MYTMYNKNSCIQLHTHSLMVAATESFAILERDVCLPMSVWVAHSENAYSLQKQNILKDFPSPRKENATFVQPSSLKLYKQKNTGQFIETQVIVIID